MKKKVLFVATVVKTHINTFHLPYLEWFRSEGYETHVAAKNDFKNDELCVIPHCDVFYDIPFERSPLNFSNLEAYRELKKVIDINNYDIIHCHTPVGALLTRIAARKSRKKGTKVIYTAHGFHFFKGAPLLNWLIYFPVEFICSFFTDVLITINQEDYHLAKKIMKARKIEYIPGVGIDVEKYQNVQVDKIAKRKELGIPENAMMLLSVGELNKNKNHEVIIEALSRLDNPNIYYCIAGHGELKDYLQNKIVSLGLEEQVQLLGYRKDISELCHVADIFCFPSLREGLSVSLMEAMCAGLPVVCSDIRGNSDLIIKKGGYKCNPYSVEEFVCSINKVVELEEKRKEMSKYNKSIIYKFSKSNVEIKMFNLYTSI